MITDKQLKETIVKNPKTILTYRLGRKELTLEIMGDKK